jgi:N-acetyl-anhydromuramyl-L-alanine amidase AmpD
MSLFGLIQLMNKLKYWFKRTSSFDQPENENTLEIRTINLNTNPKYDQNRPWGKRSLSDIDKIIIHQALSKGTTESIHNYHTSENSHLKSGGAPRISYHYTIEEDGKIYMVNNLDDVVWHCRGVNISSIGVLVIGDFDGPTHRGKSGDPTPEQLSSLKFLVDHLEKKLLMTNKNLY